RVSMPRISACGCLLQRILAWSIPGIVRSPAYTVAPRTFSQASRRGGEAPISDGAGATTSLTCWLAVLAIIDKLSRGALACRLLALAGLAHGGEDFVEARAATDIAGQVQLDLVIARRRVFLQQRVRTDDKARRAVA